MRLRKLLVLFITTGIFTACSAPPAFNGAVYNSPAPPPDFSLPATTGTNFTLSEQRNTVTLIYFGYTFCPDVCPQTLGLVRSALNLLSPEARGHIRLVFITVDPARDSLERMAGYLASFDPAFIGVAPTTAQLEQITADYDGYVEPETQDPETGAYEVGHTSLVYVVDKDGNLRLGFFSGMRPEDMAADLKILADE